MPLPKAEAFEIPEFVPIPAELDSQFNPRAYGFFMDQKQRVMIPVVKATHMQYFAQQTHSLDELQAVKGELFNAATNLPVGLQECLYSNSGGAIDGILVLRFEEFMTELQQTENVSPKTQQFICNFLYHELRC